MIILVGQQKGGCGKSTVATNISAVLAHQGLDVLLVDADCRQGTASMWYSERVASHPDLPKIHSVQKERDIEEALRDLQTRYQYVVVDAAGHDSQELRSAMIVTNILIMPFRPTNPDLATLPYMATLIKNSKRVNPELKAYAFLNAAPTNSQSKDSGFAGAAIGECSDITLLNTVVHHRRVYWDAMAEGLSVLEMDDHKAKTEITTLVAEILK